MTARFVGALVIVGMLAGCGLGASRLNPFNWFSGSTSQPTGPSLIPEEGRVAAVQDLRPLMDQVTELVIERNPGGAIIRARGLPPEQGFYDGELVSLSDGEPVDGVLEYQFRVRPPVRPTRVSTVQSREIVVGLFVSNQTLENVREIRVVAKRNTRATRR